jgi:hypothetical protein
MFKDLPQVNVIKYTAIRAHFARSEILFFRNDCPVSVLFVSLGEGVPAKPIVPGLRSHDHLHMPESRKPRRQSNIPSFGPTHCWRVSKIVVSEDDLVKVTLSGAFESTPNHGRNNESAYFPPALS